MAIFREKLGLFDVTNLVVGSVIGADIYVATSFGMGQSGPLSILAWVLAGIFAIITALAFNQCAQVIGKAGGPYAYARKAFGHFPGFITGWSLWLAELAALCVFPLAFVNYISFFFPLNFIQRTIAIAAFIALLFFTNYFGIKKAAKVNDALTIIKLAPLAIIVLLGFVAMVFSPAKFAGNFSPFAPFGFEGFGSALVLIFWAYVGFELATIPAAEIKEPKRTIPKAIIIGMMIVTVFYLVTNFMIVGIAGMQVAASNAPLAFAASVMIGSVGAIIITVGALFSVSGSDESGVIGTTRLAYAMAADGYFPRQMARLHPKYQTPFVSLAVHSIIAFIFTALLSIREFIFFSVFNFAVTYLIVTLAAFKLKSERPLHQKAILVVSVLVCIYILTQISREGIIQGIILLAIGAAIYPIMSKESEVAEAKTLLHREEHIYRRMIRHEEAFLANFYKHIKIAVRSASGRKHAYSLRERPKHQSFSAEKS